MDALVLILMPLFAFAIYGVDCLAERFSGYRLNSEAKETLDELSSHNKDKFFQFILKDKDMKKIEREMRPLIIDMALKLAVEDLKTEGEKSKIFVLMEKESKKFTA